MHIYFLKKTKCPKKCTSLLKGNNYFKNQKILEMKYKQACTTVLLKKMKVYFSSCIRCKFSACLGTENVGGFAFSPRVSQHIL